jgi:hypothetical protein
VFPDAGKADEFFLRKKGNLRCGRILGLVEDIEGLHLFFAVLNLARTDLLAFYLTFLMPAGTALSLSEKIR